MIKNTDTSLRESEFLALINYHPDYIGIIIINRLLYAVPINNSILYIGTLCCINDKYIISESIK